MFNLFKKSKPKTDSQTNDGAVKPEVDAPKKKDLSELFGDSSDQASAMFAIRKGGSGRRLEIGIEEEIVPAVPNMVEDSVEEAYVKIDKFVLDSDSKTYMQKPATVKEDTEILEDTETVTSEDTVDLNDSTEEPEKKEKTFDKDESTEGADSYDNSEDDTEDDSEDTEFSDDDPDFDD